MSQHVQRLPALFAAGTLAAGAAQAESFRCGQWIASTDMTVNELFEKCGAPTSRTTEVVEIHGPNVHGTGNVRRGTSVIEKWIYDRGSQSFTMVVTIVDGKIKSIDRAE